MEGKAKFREQQVDNKRNNMFQTPHCKVCPFSGCILLCMLVFCLSSLWISRGSCCSSESVLLINLAINRLIEKSVRQRKTLDHMTCGISLSVWVSVFIVTVRIYGRPAGPGSLKLKWVRELGFSGLSLIIYSRTIQLQPEGILTKLTHLHLPIHRLSLSLSLPVRVSISHIVGCMWSVSCILLCVY